VYRTQEVAHRNAFGPITGPELAAASIWPDVSIEAWYDHTGRSPMQKGRIERFLADCDPNA